jgi:signal peptidase I
LHWWRQPPHSSSSGGAHSNSSQYGGGGDGGGSAGSFFWPTLLVRAVVASGLVHLWTEYVSDVTLCEGPSMSPTIQPAGEIIVVDKWNPRILGLKDGDDGSVRADLARKRQVQFEQSRRNKKAEASSRATAMSSPTCCWHEPVLPSVSELEEKQQQQQKKLQFLSFYSTAWMQMRSPVSVGDVLVVQHPSRQGTVCKRVVGLPGDEILLGSGHRGFGGVAGASASSSSLLASFRASPDRSSTSTASTNRRQLVVVPDGHVWLEGDNPSNSSDSRHYGPVPASLIVGRVLFRIWPLRGRAWMLRGRRPVAAQDNYYAPPATVVLPAGYDGQPMLRQDIHDSLL